MPAGVSTDELMTIALEMAGMSEIPPDSAIHVPGTGISRLLCGIDMGAAELALAHSLGFDCVLAHHPQPAVLSFPDMVDRFVPLMVGAGVPEAEARDAVGRIKEPLVLRYQSGNYDHAPSFARLLALPYLNIHNPLDEIGRRRMQAAIDAAVRPDDPVGGVIEALLSIPEFGRAPTRPVLAMGSPSARAGRVLVAHGAGTNGGYAVAHSCFAHGVGTVVYLHCDYGNLTRLRSEAQGNLVLAGHIAADVAGIEPYLLELERRGIEIKRVSGL
ncbi:MAG: hypothetical protein Q8P31_00615 [Bacillota bacterium]|nr:hypothetical protein [Bacillota bacterium]